MFKPTTLSVARPVAETLTFNNMLLAPKAAHLPVGVMTEHYRAPVEAKRHSLSPADFDALTESFQEFNNNPSEVSEAEYDRLTELMANGLERMLTTVRTAVVPVCKMMRQRFEESGEEKRLAQIEVVPFNFHAIHSEPALTEHVYSYHNLKGRDTYRTFIMPTPSAETMIEWMSQTAHVDAEQVKHWALENLGADALETVWLQLFGSRREIESHQLDLADLGKMPFNIDKLLAAYLLAATLTNTPQEVTGESVSLEEWEEAMATLHRFLGATLCRMYERRARDRQRERVVWKYEAEDAIKIGRVIVHANGDVYPEWLERGGNVKALLGAAVSAPGRIHARDLDALSEQLVQTWDRKHYLIRQAKITNYMRTRQNDLKFMFIHPAYDVKELLPNIGSQSELEQRVEGALKAVREDDMDDMARTIMRLVCAVYYPNTPYREFLETMDQVAIDHKDLPPREVATVTAIEMTAAWLTSQVTAAGFQPLIDHPETRVPNEPAEDEGEVNDEAQVSESA